MTDQTDPTCPDMPGDTVLEVIRDLRTMARRQFEIALNTAPDRGVDIRDHYARGGAFEAAAAIVADAVDLNAADVDPEPIEHGWDTWRPRAKPT